MAISDEEKIDLLWKKFIYGVSKTETAGNKSPSNETRPSPTVALGNQIWINAKDIPTTPPAATTAAVQVKTKDGEGATALTMITDSSDAKAWRVFDVDNTTPLENWIPFSLGAGYALKLWIGDPAVASPAPTMLFLDGSGNNDEYFFDYKAGILYFIGTNLPVGPTSSLYIEGYRYIGPLDVSIFEGGGGGGSDCGNEIKLCAPTDGDLTDPALTGTLLGVTFNKGVAVPLNVDTKVTDAIDGLNEIVGLLLPDPPPAFPGSQVLAVSSVGNSPKLVDGFTNNAAAGNTLIAGSPVARVVNSNFSSIPITVVGAGDSGSLSATGNHSATSIDLGTIAFDATDNSSVVNQLTVQNNMWYPSDTPGFWQAFDCKLEILAGTLTVGVNTLRMDHTAGGSASCIIVKDNLTTNPVIDITTAGVVDSQTTIKMSSGVQHYDQNTVLVFQNIGLNDIAGQTYSDGNFFSAIVDLNNSTGSSNNPFDVFAKSHDYFGYSLPLQSWESWQYLNDISIPLTTSHCAKLFQVELSFTNVNGTTSTTYPRNMLYLNGIPAGAVMEDYIPVFGIPGASGPAERVKLTSQLPQPDKYTVPVLWDSAVACESYHATIVAGTLAHDHTDYRSYLPSSPGISAALSPNYDIPARYTNGQFVTFKFTATGVSNFDIDVIGSYTECYIRLGGITDGVIANPNDAYSTTSWWSMFKPAEAFGIPGDNTATYPGTANGSNGCARSDTVMTGTTGRFNCTFGNANSSDAAASGDIFVRFGLSNNDKISSLRFLSSTY